nr:MAG TPA: hypothetical protein [Caudoviricetes sp.]
MFPLYDSFFFRHIFGFVKNYWYICFVLDLLW